jgi:two-component system sensor histidine kinase BaeS
VLLLGLFAAGAIFMALWALAAIVGLVEAQPLVVAAGIVAFILVALGGLVSVRALGSMTRPLDDLVEASGRIEAGDYAARVSVSGAGGVRSLTRAFNQMSAQLEASDGRRRAFLADVTHELRTPLTVISGQLEAIEDGVYAADPDRVSMLLAQTRQMSQLIEDLHTISLAEVGALALVLVPTDLGAIAEEAVARFAPTAELDGIELEHRPGDSRTMAALDANATHRVLANIIRNALRHTPAGGSISLIVRPGAILEVVDTGKGMEPELAGRALGRFEKGPDSDGSGLGLAIASDLMEAQGGSLEITSTVRIGTRVALHFALLED